MKHDFWHERWAAGKLGFHQQKINARLMKFCSALELNRGDTIFVPLCGKSLDLLWLSRNGYKPLGCELSDIACRDFFVDNELAFNQTERTAIHQIFKRWH